MVSNLRRSYTTTSFGDNSKLPSEKHPILTCNFEATALKKKYNTIQYADLLEKKKKNEQQTYKAK